MIRHCLASFIVLPSLSPDRDADRAQDGRHARQLRGLGRMDHGISIAHLVRDMEMDQPKTPDGELQAKLQQSTSANV
jgi:hypothetical protein